MVTIVATPGSAWELIPEMRLTGIQAAYASESLRAWLEEHCAGRNAAEIVPFVIRHERQCVGFFALDRARAQRFAPAERNAVLLRNFLVVGEAQGCGYASRAMAALPALTRDHFPGVDAIVLVVNQTNLAARRLYLRGGFEDTGAIFPGSAAGPALIYRRGIAALQLDEPAPAAHCR